jgi:hypothetical protein
MESWGRRAIATVVALLPVLFVLLAPAARADTATIGSTTLTANNGSPADLGQNIPAFQGDAAGGYVLAATVSGTITSWSFRTAGVDPGNRFELAVLSPQDTTGTSWRLLALSPPQAVTSAGGTDALMGPFALSPGIAVQPGARIALVPIDAGNVPIEQGVNGTDGIRYFSQPFSGGLGSSQSVAAGSSADNGQVVPIQATVDTGIVTQKITGSPKAGQALTCNPGSLAGQPGLTETWYLTTWTVAAVGSGRSRHFVLVPRKTAVASGPTYFVPDLPEGDVIGCVVTAGTAQGTAPDVTVLPSIPQLARRLRHASPSITPGVGFGGTNYCTSGRWVHFPTTYSYAWYVEGRQLVGPHNHFSKLVGRGKTITIDATEELHHLLCRVTATNAAGSETADSNNYLVPQNAPQANGLPRVKVIGPDTGGLIDAYPQTSLAKPLESPSGIFDFSCTPPKFARNDVQLSYSWQIYWPPQGLPGGGIYPGNTISFPGQLLNIQTTTSTRQAYAYSVYGKPTSGTMLGQVVISGTVKCLVTAKLPHAETDVISEPLYFKEGSPS